MENRSHALMAGLFAILLLIAAAYAAIWISKKNVPLVPYELVSTSPVTGLSVQSQVRYQGVPVGRVESLRFMQDKPGVVRILIAIDPKTPITESTWAEIATAGVTGISNIELRDNGTSSQRVESSATHVADIPMRPGFWERLQQQGGGMLGTLERILYQVEKFTTAENAASLDQTLKNTASLTARLDGAVKQMEPAIKQIPVMIESISNTAKRADVAAAEIASLARSAQQTVTYLNAPGGPLHLAGQSMESIQATAAQVRSSTLPDFSALSTSVTDAARSFTYTSRDLRQAPQSLIFGPPPVAAGPGEAGFAGFGAQQR